jgi:hypothetical protein
MGGGGVGRRSSGRLHSPRLDAGARVGTEGAENGAVEEDGSGRPRIIVVRHQLDSSSPDHRPSSPSGGSFDGLEGRGPGRGRVPPAALSRMRAVARDVARSASVVQALKRATVTSPALVPISGPPMASPSARRGVTRRRRGTYDTLPELHEGTTLDEHILGKKADLPLVLGPATSAPVGYGIGAVPPRPADDAPPLITDEVAEGRAADRQGAAVREQEDNLSPSLRKTPSFTHASPLGSSRRISFEPSPTPARAAVLLPRPSSSAKLPAGSARSRSGATAGSTQSLQRKASRRTMLAGSASRAVTLTQIHSSRGSFRSPGGP